MSDMIQPIDHFVLAAFQERFQQVFGCVKCAFINQNDKTKVLERLFGQGNPLSYPFAYFVIQSVGANNESYNPHYLMRRGWVVDVPDSDQYVTVRVLPTNFELEVTYVTDKFDSVEQGSVLAFARRWLLARRGGYLKSSIGYGQKQFGISVTVPESLNIPQLGNITETETKYEVTTNLTIHGYISEPTVGQKGRVNTINVTGQVSGVNGTVVSTQFFAFPK
jgi:hypothetical protein